MIDDSSERGLPDDGEKPLRYIDGKVPRVGDIVETDWGDQGRVIAVIETGDYENDALRSFAYLGRGVLLESKEFGLLAISGDEVGVRLVTRA